MGIYYNICDKRQGKHVMIVKSQIECDHRSIQIDFLHFVLHTSTRLMIYADVDMCP